MHRYAYLATAIVIAALAAAVAIVALTAGIPRARAQTAPALSGQVTSAEEGTMEGVIVSARKDGSNITVSVVTNEQGRYSFPADRPDQSEMWTLDNARGAGLHNKDPAPDPRR